jgi:hypothetical protein
MAFSARPLTLSRIGDYLKLDWQGGALETSPDLQTWTPLPWASSPFLEPLKPLPATRPFHNPERFHSAVRQWIQTDGPMVPPVMNMAFVTCCRRSLR